MTTPNDSNAGPLSRLMHGLGIDADLAPIAAVKRIDEKPVAVSIPVSCGTPNDRICPTCAIFEIEPGTELCPRCNRRQGIRAVKVADRRRHLESVNREALALKLDAIDPDWPSKFLTTDQAARHYSDELAR